MSLKVHLKKYEKWQATVLIICFIAASFATLTVFPEKTHATCMPYPAVVTYNPATVPVSEALDPLYIVQKGYEAQIYYKTCVSDGIATIIGKQIIKALTRSIVAWINSGFKGNPSFIQNPGKFFMGVADKVAGNIIESIAPWLCSPFRLNISFGLALGVMAPGDDISCTFTDVENNIRDFADNTQSQANNWQNWFKITQRPANNPMGAIAVAQGRMNIGIASANGEQAQMLSWGNGFLSSMDCPDENPAPLTNSRQIYDANNQPVYGVQVGNNGCMIKTPGATIEAGLSDNIGSDLRGLEIAQSIDQIFAALVGQLMSQALGATGLVNSGSYQSSNGENYSIYGGKNNIMKIPLSGSCTPNKYNADINELVTWSVFVPSADGNETYLWTGDQIPLDADRTSSSITMNYSSEGVKSTSVVVTSYDGVDSQTITCTPSVTIKAPATTTPPVTPPPPPSLACRANPSTVTRSAGTNGSAIVTWIAEVSNALPGVTYSYDWTFNPGEPDNVEHANNEGSIITKTYTGWYTKNTRVVATGSDGTNMTANCSVYIKLP